MNVILFGPPGVGKSTLIGILKSRGERAVDLEDVYPNQIRFQLPSYLTDAFIGAADLNPQRKYSNCIKVLLFSSQDVYDKRRAARDARVPGKGSQSKHSIETWKKAPYDFLLDTTHLSPEQTASKLRSLMKKGGKV